MADGGALAAGGGSDAVARAVHARLLRDRSLQFDFANVKAPEPLKQPQWLKALAHFLAQMFGGAMPVVEVIFWVGVGGAVLLVVWLILREVLSARWDVRWAGRRRRTKAARPAPADWAPDRRRARALLENADRLAAQGRFDQAVRLILHRGIEDIEDRRPGLVRPALTARELAGLGAVPPGARTAFTKIAAIVEFSAFAGLPIGQGAFAECRAAYEAFAFPGAWA